MANGRDSGGIYAILVVVVILLVLIILFMTGTLGGGRQADPGPDLDVRIETPDAPSPTPPQN